jgi:hypothetical protein
MQAMTMPEVIARLERLLPVHEPELWASLQPPAAAQDLELLRQSVAPFDVTDDWIDFLAWHNGGRWSRRWWPLLDSGRLLGALEAIDHYQQLCTITEDWQWHRSWLPITHDSWNQCGIELAGDHRGLIVDGSFPDPPRPLAPSLLAMLHATCAVIEAGLRDEEPVRFPDAYVRVRQKEVIEPIHGLYGAMPTDLGPHSGLPG